jgi:chorismate mutase
MIRNKANKLWDDEKNQEKLNAERVEHQKELAEIKNDRDQSAFNRERVVKFAEKLIDENGKLQKQNIELVKKQEMLNLILSKIPQTDSETGVELASIEEIRDVGSTNPVSVTSEIK